MKVKLCLFHFSFVGNTENTSIRFYVHELRAALYFLLLRLGSNLQEVGHVSDSTNVPDGTVTITSRAFLEISFTASNL